MSILRNIAGKKGIKNRQNFILVVKQKDHTFWEPQECVAGNAKVAEDEPELLNGEVEADEA